MTSPTLYTKIPSPIGELMLVGDGEALRGLYMLGGPRPMSPRSGWTEASAPFAAVRAQLDEYFAGQRTSFDIPLAMDGTPFQLRVWAALEEIPYCRESLVRVER